MPALPPHPNLDQLRHQAKDLLHGARQGDARALERVRAVSPRLTLAAAQLVVAREYGFTSWAELKADVEARADDLQAKADAFCEASMRGRMGVAARMLAQTSAIATAGFGPAVILGDAAQVARRLARDPGLATRRDPRSDWTALHAVCSSRWARVSETHAEGTLAVARLLIEAGADVSARTGRASGPSDGWSPLRCATAITNNGPANEPVIRLLLEHGAAPGDHDLYLAAFAGDDHRCLRLLLDHTDRVRQIVAQALSAPISTGDTAALALLLDAGADPARYADDDGNPCSAVHAAVADDCSAELLALLLSHRADPGAVGPDGRSPNQVATANGRRDLIELLRRHGAGDDAGDTDALLYACRTADREAAQRLVATDATLVERLTDGERAATIQAAERDDTAALELMLDLGFPIDARGGDDGATALHAAGYGGAADCVALLVARGADIEARDTSWGGTPIDWALIGSSEHPTSALAPDWERAVFALIDAGARTDAITLEPDDPKPPSPRVAELLRSRGIGHGRDERAVSPRDEADRGRRG